MPSFFILPCSNSIPKWWGSSPEFNSLNMRILKFYSKNFLNESKKEYVAANGVQDEKSPGVQRKSCWKGVIFVPIKHIYSWHGFFYWIRIWTETLKVGCTGFEIGWGYLCRWRTRVLGSIDISCGIFTIIVVKKDWINTVWLLNKYFKQIFMPWFFQSFPNYLTDKEVTNEIILSLSIFSFRCR